MKKIKIIILCLAMLSTVCYVSGCGSYTSNISKPVSTKIPNSIETTIDLVQTGKDDEKIVDEVSDEVVNMVTTALNDYFDFHSKSFRIQLNEKIETVMNGPAGIIFEGMDNPYDSEEVVSTNITYKGEAVTVVEDYNAHIKYEGEHKYDNYDNNKEKFEYYLEGTEDSSLIYTGYGDGLWLCEEVEGNFGDIVLKIPGSTTGNVSISTNTFGMLTPEAIKLGKDKNMLLGHIITIKISDIIEQFKLKIDDPEYADKRALYDKEMPFEVFDGELILEITNDNKLSAIRFSNFTITYNLDGVECKSICNYNAIIQKKELLDNAVIPDDVKKEAITREEIEEYNKMN